MAEKNTTNRWLRK